MIRDELDMSGFPVCRRAPVLCIVEGGFAVAHSRAELRYIAERFPGAKCAGVWPGKANSEVFSIDLTSYASRVPPALHADIDSAGGIVVHSGSDPRVEYVPGPHASDRTPVVSRDPALIEYVRGAALQHRECCDE